MNNEITYNNHDNESIYDNENNNNNSIIPYLAIVTILLMSFGGQCLRCKFNNNNNKNLKNFIVKDLEDNLIKECSICLSEMKINEKLVILSCKHYFHKECITEWLKKSRTCPECRINLD